MDSEHIESIRQNNFGIMLISLIEDYERRFTTAYEAAGFGDVRRPHGYVLRYLEQEGSCITDIAQRAGITKQTIGKIVQELVRLRYVEVGGVAGDGRVRLVRFSKRGRQLVDISQQLVQRLHDEYAVQVGAATFERFEETLQLLVKQLGCAIPRLGGENGPAAKPFFHFGRFMVEIAEDFERRLRVHLSARGFDGIKPSYLAVLFHLDIEGSRLTALAQRVAVTPQATSLTINEMMRANIIVQRTDPIDQRARLILLTAHGAVLMEAIALAAETITEEYAVLIGGDAVTRLRDCLLKILRRLRISVFV
jgi:DNA-binding MarR family transcriptional regulator